MPNCYSGWNDLSIHKDIGKNKVKHDFTISAIALTLSTYGMFKYGLQQNWKISQWNYIYCRQTDFGFVWSLTLKIRVATFCFFAICVHFGRKEWIWHQTETIETIYWSNTFPICEQPKLTLFNNSVIFMHQINLNMNGLNDYYLSV